jgi:hypothetical protein
MHRLTKLPASMSRSAAILAIVVALLVAACKGGGSTGY